MGSLFKILVACEQIVGGSGNQAPVRLAAALHTIPTLSKLILIKQCDSVTFYPKTLILPLSYVNKIGIILIKQ